LATGGEFSSHPLYFSTIGGGYWRFRFPIKLYYFPTQNTPAWLVDIKFRPELGRPLFPFLPRGFIDLGYQYAENNWFAKEPNHSLQSLMLGGWFSIPLLEPKTGRMMVSGSKSIAGDNFTRFSCYLDWFFSPILGMTLHGDNFHEKKNGKSYWYGFSNLGLVVRL